MSKLTERGQALILIALAAVGLFAFSALAIDGSRAFSDRRHAQNAADTAVLAAALKYIRTNGDFTAATAAAQERATSNGYTHDGTNTLVEIALCSTVPCAGLPAGANASEYIRVKIVSTIPTTFARVIGRQTLTSAVEAIARVQTGSGSPSGSLFDGAGMVTTRGGYYDQCFLLNGEGTVTVHGAGIFVNCSHPQAALLNSKSKLYMDASGKIVGCLFGNGGYYSDPVDCWQAAQTIDATTFASVPTKEPTPTCSGNGGVSPGSTGTYLQNGNSITVKTGTVTLTEGNFGNILVDAGASGVVFSPGTYCVSGIINTSDPLTGSSGTVQMVLPSGLINLNSGSSMNFSDLEIYSSSSSTLTLNSGVPVNASRFRYFSDGTGGVTINSGASLTSDDAYIYLEKGNITWNGNSTIDLESPTAGSYAGLLFYKPWDNPTTQIDFNAGSNINMVGTFLAPSSRIVYNSQVDFVLHSQIIGYTFVTNSKANIDIYYDPARNYGGSAAADPTIELTK